MRNTIAIVVGVMLSFGVALTAQAPQAPPKPGPEHKKLDYFVGKWTGTGKMEASPFGPAGKITSTDDCQWFDGGFAVICHGQGTGPMGTMKSIGILSYDMDKKVFTYYGQDNTAMVMTTVPKGTVQGDTWTYNDEGTMGGQPYKSKMVLKIVSPTSYTFNWAMAGADGKWNTIVEGTSTKAK